MDVKEGKKSSKVKWIIMLVSIGLLLFEFITGIDLKDGQIFGKRNASDLTEKTGDGVDMIIDPNAEHRLPYEDTGSFEQGVVIAGWESMTFSSNTKEESVDFFNPEANAHLYYLTFELRLYQDDKQGYEVLYTSNLVEPGKSIRHITLSRTLEKGVYDAVVHVQPYRMDATKTLTNNADIKIKLIVN